MDFNFLSSCFILACLTGCSVNTSLLGSSSSSHADSSAPMLKGDVTHLLGIPRGTGSVDGIGSFARFNGISGVTSDGTNLYVTGAGMYGVGSHTIRKVSLATAMVTTIAGQDRVTGSADGIGTMATFNNPSYITTDGTNLYVSDSNNYTVRKIVIATGAVSTLAGNPGVNGTTNGVGSGATFSYPTGIATDGANVYVVDYNSNLIRQIVIATGAVTTLAGGATGSVDGTGTSAGFTSLSGLTIVGGDLYVVDSDLIRKIVVSTGVVTTYAGGAGGSTDGVGTAASFHWPNGLSNDGTNLYVVDSGNNTIRKIDISSATVTTIAGSVGIVGSDDGIGAAASFNGSRSIASVGGNLYVTDFSSNTLRKISLSTSAVSTYAGMAPIYSYEDGSGNDATFLVPTAAAAVSKTLYVVDGSHYTIRKVSILTGAVSTFAGTPGVSGNTDGNGASATFGVPQGIATDGTNLYVTDAGNQTIRKIVIATGVVSTLAGQDGVPGSADGIGTAATFSTPGGIVYKDGNLYVVDYNSSLIRKIDVATAAVTTIAGTGSIGSQDGPALSASFNYPTSIAESNNALYITDTSNNTIRKLDLATSIVSTVGGVTGQSGTTDGASAIAKFNNPQGIATNGVYIYVADTSNQTIRVIEIASGIVSTLAGTPGTSGEADGFKTNATFSGPGSMILLDNVLYCIQSTNSSPIRVIQ
jgi:sugar lactone lactonase YvrE